MAESLYRFGSFTVDENTAELCKGAERVSIRPKCLDLLLYFVRHPRMLITKETLLAAVWSDAVVVEATLTRTMAELRSLLDDDPHHPRVIETVARRGYKFIADLEPGSTAAPLPPRQAEFVLIDEGKTYPLSEGVHVIGRTADADIRVPNPLVSRRHAELRVNGTSLTLEDLGSRNGTYVNDIRVRHSTNVGPGDRIRIGEQTLLLWLSDGARTAPGRFELET